MVAEDRALLQVRLIFHLFDTMEVELIHYIHIEKTIDVLMFFANLGCAEERGIMFHSWDLLVSNSKHTMYVRVGVIAWYGIKFLAYCLLPFKNKKSFTELTYFNLFYIKKVIIFLTLLQPILKKLYIILIYFRPIFYKPIISSFESTKIKGSTNPAYF